jgi:threonine synthase
VPYSTLSHLECPGCGRRFDASVRQGLCAGCDLDAVRRLVSREVTGMRRPDLWRYDELLPVADPSRLTSLGEGFTPLLPAGTLGGRLGVPDLLIKDESPLPAGSFKARGAAVGVSRARELGAGRLAMPTNGNAGSAWAAARFVSRSSQGRRFSLRRFS